MRKKQLSRQQLSRIQQQQDAKAAQSFDHDLHPESGVPGLRGLVLSRFGKQLDVEALEGELAGTVFRCYQRSNLDALVTGDEVVFQPGDDTGVVIAALPRHSLLQRPAKTGELKPVAANIDTMVIVIAPEPPAHYNLIDRYLVAAETFHFRPVLLLNKCDLLNQDNAAAVASMMSLYISLGYTCLQVSSKQRVGLESLQATLKDATSVFVGQSGVGKSALVNALLPGTSALEGTLSESESKGKHTTTSARLFHFPEGGRLIDSPGIREFGLTHISDTELLAGFVELRPLLGTCHFRDCKHEVEKGCAILDALQSGKVDARRMQSYAYIRNTLS